MSVFSAPLAARTILADAPPPFVLILVVAGVLGLLTVLLFLVVPRLRYRLLLALRAGVRYRIRSTGREQIPEGGAILVCNTLAYLDWLLVLLAQRRSIRFLLLDAPRDALTRRLARSARAITLENGIDAALDAAGEALARGELVCIFTGRFRAADGSVLDLTRTLQVLGSVPIVPVCVNQRWGSLFHLEGDCVVFRTPIERPHAVDVVFGKPLPSGTSAGEVVQAVQLLSAEIALRRETIPPHRCFVRMAARHPFRPCVFDSSSGGPTLSFGKVLAGAMCLRDLLNQRVGDAAMVAVWLPPGTGGLLSNVALAMLGKTSVNLNYTAGVDAIHSALRQCGIRHVLTARRFTARMPLDLPPGVEPINLDELLPLVTPRKKLMAFLKVVLLPGFILERWVLGLGSHTADNLATIIFSSGSTGEPKGVMLTHGNVMANVESMIQAIGLTASDRLLGVLPFFHSFGYSVTLWAPLTCGASMVYHADPRQAKEIGELCREHRSTIFLNTPTFLRFCLKRCEPEEFRSLRLLICGAEKLPPSLAAEFEARFGVLPLEGYGCTELSPAAAANTPDVTVAGGQILNNKTGSIGPPLPGVSARVVDPDTMQTLPAGQDGLVLIRGANVMLGYLNRPELTAQVLGDREYSTGDVGRIDEDGYVTLTGRLSRFAKIGGEMVPLERIEEELHGLLQTSERVLAVASIPDEKKGERLVVLHLEQMEATVAVLCRGLSERGLPNLWVPGERDFFPVPHLPLLGSGKLDLKGVKDLALLAAQRGPGTVSTVMPGEPPGLSRRG